MALLVVVGIWLVIGGSIYREAKRARTAPRSRTPVDTRVEFGRRHVRAEIPETVPSEWVEAYRSENGG